MALESLALNLEGVTRIVNDRAMYIRNAKELKDWIGSNVSTLVVNGREPEDVQISAVTLFTMFFTARLDAKLPALFLYWFCATSPQKDAKDMTVSLLAQLLQQGTPGLAVPNKNKVSTFKELVDVFLKCVLQQLKDTDIFLVIDSISICENEQRREDTLYLFDGLAKLVKKAADHKTLQLLVTSPTTTDIAAKYVNKLVINVPSNKEYRKMQYSKIV